MTNKLPISIFFFFIFSFFSTVSSQNLESNFIEEYEKYTKTTREVAYIHFNKSTYSVGEKLGFSAYLLDKNKKESFPLTKNLYCVVTNEKNETIKSKLILVKNGFANNIFEIDSLFSSGIYTLKAYTNWMLNFNEKNYFEQPFQVIKKESVNKKIKEVKKEYSFDILPEGGHLLFDAWNNIGIIVKDENGIGLSGAEGKILSEKNELITEFNLNQFGIQKIPFYPNFGKKYKISISKNDTQLVKQIDNIDVKGINLSLSFLRNKIGLTLKTNNLTLPDLKNKEYLLAIHNGYKIETVSFVFGNNPKLEKVIENKFLFTGVNIITIIDKANKKPILERIFFKNSEEIVNTKIEEVLTTKKNDSILIKIKLNKVVDNSRLQNFSVSVLPEETKSNNFNSNIISQLYLESYLNGSIQNVKYYFSNNDPKTLYDLDNLLLTQGWSSYSWDDIFEGISYKYKFEEGINIVANINGEKGLDYFVHPLKNNSSQIFDTALDDNAFVQTNLFPEDDETYTVSLVKKEKKLKKPALYINFYPVKIPKLNRKKQLISFNPELADNKFEAIYNNFFSDEFEILDEVTIKATERNLEKEKIINRSMGKVDFFDERKTQGGLTLATYLSGRGWIARVNPVTGVFTIVNPNPPSPNNSIPLVILDDAQLIDNSVLVNLDMGTVDYIESNKSGLGYGLRAGGGVIKIVTDPVKRLNSRNSSSVKKYDLSSYEFPLTFSSEKKFYVPKYTSFRNSFFKNYGVIGWFPKIKTDKDGYINFKIIDSFQNNVIINLEGLFNGNVLISDKRTIKMN